MFTIFDSGIGPAATLQAAPSKPSLPERLYRDLQAHRDSQAAIMAKTRRAEGLAATPLAEYLLQMIGENETRQAEVLARMAASLRDALSWSRSADALPDRASGFERAETIKSMRELLRLEGARARSARRLAKAYTGIGGGLEQALLEASAMAGESNAHLLRTWLRSFKARTRGMTTLARITTNDEDASPTLAA
jgi:hypothetical protein